MEELFDVRDCFLDYLFASLPSVELSLQVTFMDIVFEYEIINLLIPTYINHMSMYTFCSF